MGDTAGFNAILHAKLSNIVGGRLSFDRGIGRQDQFVDLLRRQPLFETIQPDIIRPDTVQRRQVSHQHEVTSGKLPGLLNGVDVRRTLHHANLTVFLATRVRADVADVLLCEGAAIGTVADFRHRLR